jgi:predicted RNase H-like HicB family nuclease
MQMTTEPLHLTAVFESVENGWVQARVPELPGVITAAPTREEARSLLLDAVREYLLSLLTDPPAAPATKDAAQESLEVTFSAAA